MNQFFYNKKYWSHDWTKKGAKNVAARRSSPWQSWMKVHLDKTVQTARSEENEQAQFSENVF